MTTLLFRVLDFETSGFPPDAGICEVGWTDVVFHPASKTSTVGGWQSELTDPGYPIEIAAMAIHHITEDDIKGCRPASAVLAELDDGVDYYVAHNSKFERQLYSPPQAPWICTLKAAYRLCPKSPNHQNQTIRYFLRTPVDRALALHSHRAGPDSYVTAHTLAKFLTVVDPLTLTQWEQQPPHMPYCPIGAQWKGKPWEDVDTSFLQWMMKTKTMEEDLKYNAKRELDRRFPDHKARHEQNNTGGFKNIP